MPLSANKFNDLEQAILKTVAYFDIFDYPVTLVEIYKWLYLPKLQQERSYTLHDISQALNSEKLKTAIDSKAGFYFLPSRQEIINQRLWRYQLANKKFKIALLVSRFLRWLPFIKMIAICNTTGYNNASEKSDIDFFIIVKNGRLWLARLLITILVTSLGIRQHGRKIANRICLSFYLTDNSLDLSAVALKPNDVHLVYWLATTFAPIYDAGIYQHFFTANNWLKDFLPNLYEVILTDRLRIKNKRLNLFLNRLGEKLSFGYFGDFLEKIARQLQIKRINRYFGQAINQSDHNVVISKSMLKFHKTDRRFFYQEAWLNKLRELNLS